MREVCAQMEADAYRQVQHETWGHLAPTNGTHELEMVYTTSVYGDCTLISVKHPTLDDSPWLFSSLHDLRDQLTSNNDLEDDDTPYEQGSVCKFVGKIVFGYPKEDAFNDLKNVFDTYIDDEENSYQENGYENFHRFLNDNNCKTIDDVLETFKNDYILINKKLESYQLEYLIEAIHVRTMIHWEGSTEVLVPAL